MGTAVATAQQCRYCARVDTLTCFSCKAPMCPDHIDPQSRIFKRCLPGKYQICPKNPKTLYGDEYGTPSEFLPSLGRGVVNLGSWLLIALVVLGVVYLFTANNITPFGALQRFKEIAGTENVTIVRNSNPEIAGGDPYNVWFELRVDDQRYNGYCTSGPFSPMVCELHPSS